MDAGFEDRRRGEFPELLLPVNFLSLSFLFYFILAYVTTNGKQMDPFRSFMVKLSEHITDEELNQLKFLFEIPRGRAEKIQTALDFLRYLKETMSLHPENVDVLTGLKGGFNVIKRQDLILMVDKYTQGTWTQEQPDILENVQDCCEKNGINMQFSGGSFYRTSDISYLETNYNDRRKVKMTNLNEYGCKVTISCDGKIVIRKKLNSQEEINFMFEFHKSDCEDQSCGQKPAVQEEGGPPFDLWQCLQATIEPEAYDVYYSVRMVDNNSNVYFTNPKNIQVVKTTNAKIQAALEKTKEDCGLIGTCFFDGEKMWAPHELLSSAVKNHSKECPLLLLQNPEKIVVKLANEVASNEKVQLMQIKVNPSQLTEHILDGIKSQIHCDDSCEIKVDGGSLETNWMKCFNDHPIEVAKKDEYRGTLSLARPLRSNLLFEAQSLGPISLFGADDELLDMIEHGHKSVSSSEELAPVQTQMEHTASKSDDVKAPDDTKMITSPADKVILTVYVVPPNAPPLL